MLRRCFTHFFSGATITPSEEESLAFSVTPLQGDAYKLKAGSTRDRQNWINRLRMCAEDQKEQRIKRALAAEAAKTAEK